MQDKNTTMTTSATASAIITEHPGPDGMLPPHLMECIAAADVIVLLGSSEADDLALTIQMVYASPQADPGLVASHAYARAIQEAHGELLKAVRGEPTDADKFRAFRAFAIFEQSDPARYAAINEAVKRFEDAVGVDEKKKADPNYMDQVAAFLVHAVAETEGMGAKLEEVPD